MQPGAGGLQHYRYPSRVALSISAPFGVLFYAARRGKRGEMPPSKKGPKRDTNLVAMAKMLHAAGETTTAIAKQIGRSVPTTREYIRLAEEDGGLAALLEEVNDDNQIMLAENLWRLVHKGTLRLEQAIDAGDLKAKDLAVAWGIALDKIMKIIAMRNTAKGRGEQAKQTLTINLFSSGGGGDAESGPGPLNDSTSLPFIEGEISGDDNGTGGRQDLLRLPGSGIDDAEHSEH